MFAERAPLVLFALLTLFGCGSGEAPREPKAVSSNSAPLSFEFVAVNGERMNATRFRGRTTVIVFATTFDLNSQGAISLLNAEFRSLAPRINALVVMLEPPKNMELVRTYAATLGLEIPLTIADEATFRGEGELGALKTVPTFLVLDERGVLREAYAGLPSSAVLRALVAKAR